MEYKAIYDDAFKSACRPQDVDPEKLVIYTDDFSGVIRRGDKRHRLGYQVDGRIRPLVVALERPMFSGDKPHPIPVGPHHQDIPLFGSAKQCSEGLNDDVRDMLKRIVDKIGAKESTDHFYVTHDCRVYSVKCETFWDRPATLDHLTFVKVNGVLVIPDFHEDNNGNICCHMKIVMACVE